MSDAKKYNELKITVKKHYGKYYCFIEVNGEPFSPLPPRHTRDEAIQAAQEFIRTVERKSKIKAEHLIVNPPKEKQ